MCVCVCVCVCVWTHRPSPPLTVWVKADFTGNIILNWKPQGCLGSSRSLTDEVTELGNGGADSVRRGMRTCVVEHLSNIIPQRSEEQLTGLEMQAWENQQVEVQGKSWCVKKIKLKRIYFQRLVNLESFFFFNYTYVSNTNIQNKINDPYHVYPLLKFRIIKILSHLL